MREGVWKSGFELGDVEDGVDPSELSWEADCDRVCPWGTYYLKWSQVFSASFLEGQVVWKNFTFTYAQSPTLKAGDGICWQSATFW